MTDTSPYFDILDSEFQTLWQKLQANGDYKQTLAKIIKEYDQLSRGHHNVQHLTECVQLLNEHGNDCQEFHTMKLAFFWHDVVYNPSSHNNEIDSMTWAVAEMSQAGVSYLPLSKMSRFILTHESGIAIREDEDDAKLFRDIDYWILGSPKQRYQQYAQGIALEYGSDLDPERYKTGRKAFLETLLQESKSSSIFLTQEFQKRFGKQALANIAWEIESLAEA